MNLIRTIKTFSNRSIWIVKQLLQVLGHRAHHAHVHALGHVCKRTWRPAWRVGRSNRASMDPTCLIQPRIGQQSPVIRTPGSSSMYFSALASQRECCWRWDWLTSPPPPPPPPPPPRLFFDSRTSQHPRWGKVQSIVLQSAWWICHWLKIFIEEYLPSCSSSSRRGSEIRGRRIDKMRGGSSSSSGGSRWKHRRPSAGPTLIVSVKGWPSRPGICPCFTFPAWRAALT